MSNHNCWSLPTAVRLSTTRSPLSPSTWMSVPVIKRETTTDINLRYIWIGLRCLLLEVSGTHKSQHTWHVPSTWGATSTSLRPHVYFVGPPYHRTTHFVLSTATEQTTCTLKSLYLFTQSFRHISVNFDPAQWNFIWHQNIFSLITQYSLRN